MRERREAWETVTARTQTGKDILKGCQYQENKMTTKTCFLNFFHKDVVYLGGEGDQWFGGMGLKTLLQ